MSYDKAIDPNKHTDFSMGYDGQQPLKKESTWHSKKIEEKTFSAKPDGCDWKTPLQWIGVAFATAAFAIGLLSLLLNLGVFEMNASVALYMTIGGFGGALITSLLLGVAKILDYCHKATDEGSVMKKNEDKTCWQRFTSLCSRTPTDDVEFGPLDK